jgi:ABC-type branched-subunit amino acid transport system ATPase component
MQHRQLQMASDVVLRHFRSVAPMREMTMVEEVLFRCHSSGTSQQGSVARCREGYVVLILVLMSGSLALVGTL